MSHRRNQHGFHPATTDTAPRHDAIREACIDLAETIDEMCPVSEETEEAQKALHIVRMWANMAIAVHGAPLATPEQATTPSRKMMCPNCGNIVDIREQGIPNPHWVEAGYEKGHFSCE